MVERISFDYSSIYFDDRLPHFHFNDLLFTASASYFIIRHLYRHSTAATFREYSRRARQSVMAIKHDFTMSPASTYRARCLSQASAALSLRLTFHLPSHRIWSQNNNEGSPPASHGADLMIIYSAAIQPDFVTL
jgi:hypothetical protein